MAQKIAEGIEKDKKVKAILCDLVEVSTENCVDNINNSCGVVFGSCTILNDALPPIYNVLSELNPVINKGLVAGAFGSYGWSGEAVPNIESRLSQLKLKKPLESIKICFKPSDDDLDDCYTYGVNFANELLV